MLLTFNSIGYVSIINFTTLGVELLGWLALGELLSSLFACTEVFCCIVCILYACLCYKDPLGNEMMHLQTFVLLIKVLIIYITLLTNSEDT